jgi:hypothetical protein
MARKERHARKAIHRQGIELSRARDLPDIEAGSVDWLVGLADRRERHHFPFMRVGDKLILPQPGLANAPPGRNYPFAQSVSLKQRYKDSPFVHERSEAGGLSKNKRFSATATC